MPFQTPLKAHLLNDRAIFPWILLSPLVYESDLTGETYTAPTHFRTDGASVPKAILLLPLLAMRFMGEGVWCGFKAGVMHDYLRRTKIVPAKVAHLVFREALVESDYPPDLVSAYYAAVVAFNS